MRRRITICLLNKSRDLIILFLGAVLTCCCMVFIGFNPLTFNNPNNEKLIYARLDGCSGPLNTTGFEILFIRMSILVVIVSSMVIIVYGLIRVLREY